MQEYLIKQGNVVKFFPSELRPIAVILLGQEPDREIPGDNRQYHLSDKVDCLPFASYIMCAATAEEVEAITKTIVESL